MYLNKYPDNAIFGSYATKPEEQPPGPSNFFHRNYKNQPRQFNQQHNNQYFKNKYYSNQRTVHQGKMDFHNYGELSAPASDTPAINCFNNRVPPITNSFVNNKKMNKFNKKFNSVKTKTYYPLGKPQVIDVKITNSSISQCAIAESKSVLLAENYNSVAVENEYDSVKQTTIKGNNYIDDSYGSTAGDFIEKHHPVENNSINLFDYSSVVHEKDASNSTPIIYFDEYTDVNEEEDEYKPPPLSNIRSTPLTTIKSFKNLQCNDHKRNTKDRVILSRLTAKDLDYDRYARYSQHESEIKDYVRTITYKNAIEQNVDKLQNSVVMVLRAGLGLLAMMCVKHGRARRVIALETSLCAEYAKQIIKDNGMSHIITVLCKKPSEINSLKDFGVQYVDAIVSDWMGDCVLGHGDQLEDLIVARDTFLKPKGLLIPENVQLYAQAHDSRRHFQYNYSVWHDVYGFNMDAVTSANFNNGKKSKKNEKKETNNIKQPIITFFDPYKVVSSACILYEWDLYKCSLKEACGVHNIPLQLTFTRKDYCHLLELFFVVDFPSAAVVSDKAATNSCSTARSKKYDPSTLIGFSTSSFSPKTRYRQCGLLLDQELIVEKGDTFNGSICIWREQRNKNITTMNKKNIKKMMCQCCKKNTSMNLENSLMDLRNEYLNISLKYDFKNIHVEKTDVLCKYELLRQIF